MITSRLPLIIIIIIASHCIAQSTNNKINIYKNALETKRGLVYKKLELK